MRLLSALALALALLAAAPAMAQPAPATLVADRIDFDDGRLTASGSVEVFADGRILRASRITYLRAEDRLLVEGPVTLVDDQGSILVADFASLSADLRGSVLRGARLVLDRQLQIAAAEISTGAEGRYTQLYQTVASSCEVCAEGGMPLWQIRARRIVHDREERQLYFEGARFEVGGVPIAWLPRLRLPDPTLERASGLLAPRFSSDDLLGTGIALPYFLALGPSRDLTVTPFVTNTETRALSLRYRQAFDNGTLEVSGAVADDNVTGSDLRSYLFATGRFDLARDYRLELDLAVASDDTVLVDYDITDEDRLENRLAITRVDRDDRTLGEVIVFQTLRADESNDLLPTRFINIERERRIPRGFLGGEMTWLLQAQARERPADVAPDGADPSSARDVFRASAAVDWRRSTVTDAGFVATAMAGLDLDAYAIGQDPSFPDDAIARAVPYIGYELRLPLARDGADGVRHVLEPVAQAILSPSNRPVTPDEDSLTPEFDGGNLFSVQRFAGRDTRELGNRLNLGVQYTRFTPNGWQVGALVGRVLRAGDLGQFRTGTGLDGKSSDWLVAGSAEWRDSVAFLTRSTFDDSLEFSRSETILSWRGDDHDLSTSYTWLEADDAAGRPIDTSEWAFDASIGLGGDWTGQASWAYDFITDDASSAGVGVTYQGDCVTMDFGVKRRFTSTDALEPTTTFGLGVELAGFGADSADKRRRCG